MSEENIAATWAIAVAAFLLIWFGYMIYDNHFSDQGRRIIPKTMMLVGGLLAVAVLIRVVPRMWS